MSGIMPKKMLTINIYNILKKYSDADHPLSQKMIIDLLQSEYGMEVERKAVKRNLELLEDSGLNIRHEGIERTGRNGEKEELCTDWYLLRDFSDTELHFLIDSLMFEKNIPSRFLEDIISKLANLSGKYFRHKVPKLRRKHNNFDFFLNVELIYEAIEKGKQIAFRYNRYDTDKKLHPITDENGKPKEFVVDPYRMVMTGGKYFLLGREQGTSVIENYQVDRITGIRLLDSNLKKVKEIEKSFDLSEYVAEHVYMFSGCSERVVFRANRIILSDIVDWFGDNVDFLEADDGYVTASVRANTKAMKYWAIQYMKYVTVISPNELKEDICSIIENALGNYKKN